MADMINYVCFYIVSQSNQVECDNNLQQLVLLLLFQLGSYEFIQL